jgi:hypothetical protein
MTIWTRLLALLGAVVIVGFGVLLVVLTLS